MELLEERVTKRKFPFSKESKDLYACSVRCMLGWCFLPQARAYAYGVYCDRRFYQAAERMLRGHPPEGSLTKMVLDECEREAAGDSTAQGGTISVLLLMNIPIDGAHLAHGFLNSAGKRIQRKVGNGESMQELRFITDAIQRIPTLNAGDEVEFCWNSAEGWLGCLVNGKEIARSSNPVLARTIIDCYVSERSVSVPGAKAFSENLEGMARQGRGYAKDMLNY